MSHLTGARVDTGVFTYDTPNLGDEMQAFAALAHLDRAGTFVNRDRMADFAASGETACLFNAWFGRGDDFRRPSSVIRPLWYGFTGKAELFDSPWMGYLAEGAPIGCRDRQTTEMLLEAGVDAFWSGCLTLFLGEALGFAPADREGILFVDVPPAAEAHIPAEIVRRATRLSTFTPPSIMQRPLERWAAVARIVDRLARAALVVTRRLHVALPAASFGTPVIAIPDPDISFARRRFSGVETFIPTVFLDRAAQDLGKVDWSHVPRPSVPAQLMERHAALCDTLRSQGLADTRRAATPLDDLRRVTQRIRNTERMARPGRVRLTLNDRRFELDVRFWCDRYIDVSLAGFPGLSKFAFEVHVCRGDDREWVTTGLLPDLVL